MTGKKLLYDVDSVEPYKEIIQKIIQELLLMPHQVYNANESGLFWCILLKKKTFVYRKEANAPGRKIAKERIIFTPCSNSSGNHELNLLVIG